MDKVDDVDGVHQVHLVHSDSPATSTNFRVDREVDFLRAVLLSSTVRPVSGPVSTELGTPELESTLHPFR